MAVMGASFLLETEVKPITVMEIELRSRGCKDVTCVQKIDLPENRRLGGSNQIENNIKTDKKENVLLRALEPVNHLDRVETKLMKYNPFVAHIVYASDDKFAEILGVSLISLYENNRELDDIVVFILDSGITLENKQKILSVNRRYQRSDVTFIPAKNISDKLSMNVAIDRGSLSQYSRLFVSSDLPVGMNRILYLDCDIIINQSIGELWNLDLQGKTVGVLMDAFSKYYRQNIDLEENDIMFNSGVMLIDLEKWKEESVEKKVLEFIAAKHGQIQQGDQGALNAVLSHEAYCFEPRFNSVTIFYDFNYKNMMIYRRPPKFYTEEQIKKAVDEPVIIHFTTSFLSKRPWIKGCKHRYVDKWMQYKAMSPWKNLEPWEDSREQWKQKVLEVYKKLPIHFAIRLVGLMQVYGRPLLNKIKEK